MYKKLNETIHKNQLRLLNIDKLRERIKETLEADETDEKALEQLSAEVQRRLAKGTKPEARTVLQEIADRIYQHRVMNSAQKNDAPDSHLNKLRDELLRDDDHFRGRGACMCSVPIPPTDDDVDNH